MTSSHYGQHISRHANLKCHTVLWNLAGKRSELWKKMQAQSSVSLRLAVWLDVIHYGTRLSLGIVWMGAVLAIWSLSNYFANVWPHFRYPHGPPPPEVSMPFERSLKSQ